MLTTLFAAILALGGALSTTLPVQIALLAVLIVGANYWLVFRRERITWPPGALQLCLALALYAVILWGASERRLGLAAWWWVLLYAAAWWALTSRAFGDWPQPRGLCLAVLPVILVTLVNGLLFRDYRPGGLLGDPNLVSITIALVIPCGLEWCFDYRAATGRLPFLALVWLGMAAVALFINASVSGWMAAINAVVVYLILARRVNRKSGIALGLMSVVLVVGSLVYFRIVYFGNLTDLSWTIELHARVWRAAWQAWLDHSLIGLGPRSFAAAYLSNAHYPELFIPPHAHNLILQVLSEAGLVGLLAVILALAMLWSHWRRCDLRTIAPAAAGIVALLAGQIVDYSLWAPTVALLALAVAALPRPAAETAMLFNPGTEASRRWARPAAALLCMGLMAGAVFSLWGYAPAWAAYRAARAGQWAEAAQLYDLAYSRDRLAVYAGGRATALTNLAVELQTPAFYGQVQPYVDCLHDWPWDWARRALVRPGDVALLETAYTAIGPTTTLGRLNHLSGVVSSDVYRRPGIDMLYLP